MSDPIINSQVQSPLVRTLVSVPSKSTSFTHGIADNVPPFSREKIEFESRNSDTETVHKFRIPENGFLARMYLKVIIDKDDNGSGTANVNKWLASSFVQEVTLQSHNKILQRIYPEQQTMELQRRDVACKEAYNTGMTGYISSTEGKPNTNTPSVATLAAEEVFTCLIPLMWSSMEGPFTNYQTKFVEDLEVWVTRYSNAQINPLVTTGAVDSIKLKLVCLYHTFHDNVENAIRNKNYKKGVPASILQSDIVEETDVGTLGTSMNVKLRSNHLIYAIYVRAESGGKTNSDPSGNVAGNQLVPIEASFKGSGRTLWTTDGVEASFDTSPYPLATTPLCVRGQYDAFTDSMFCIDFSMNGDAVINTGSVALQSIADPTLSLTFATAPTRCKVYVVYRNLVRIDSDTGVLTRTMDV